MIVIILKPFEAGFSCRSPAEIMGSNPAEGMDVCLL
jgi:hypothetical protein